MAQRPLGMVRPDMRPDVIMMICTAGHVDHGKTSLVKLLTGCETDRLKEEKERGLTIEVGYAPCYLGDNLSAGIADVPGHEKFIRNMVAGVAGIDLALLVIAADDGVMPQTVEHCQIMDLLGVRHGLVALTKIDLAGPERTAQASEEVRAFLKGGFLDAAPICPVSSKTGQGFFEFYQVLVERIRAVEKRRSAGLFRMPIDRVFVSPGSGTVVTGIPVAGRVQVGDAVQVVPGGLEGRVRSMERFTREAAEGSHGQCLALSIPELSKRPPERGDLLCLPGSVEPADAFHLFVQTVPGLDPPLKASEAVHFHTGRAEIPGRLLLLEGERMGASERGLASVVLEKPVPAVAGDRFILRRPSPTATIAGGEILGAPPKGRRPRRRELVARLKDQVATLEGLDPATPRGMERRIAWALKDRFPAGGTLAALSRATLLAPDAVGTALAQLVASGEAEDLGAETFITALALKERRAELETRLENATEEGGKLSLDLATLRRGLDWPQPLWQRLQEELERERVASFRQTKVVSHRAVAGLSTAEQDLLERIRGVFRETGWSSPRPDELPGLLRADPALTGRLIEVLYSSGELVRLTRLVTVSMEAFREAQAKVVEIIRRDGFLDSSQFKNVIGSSRKYAIALLDYLDTRHITMRTQHNNRKLAMDYEKRLI